MSKYNYAHLLFIYFIFSFIYLFGIFIYSEVEPRISGAPDKPFTTELYPQPYSIPILILVFLMLVYGGWGFWACHGLCGQLPGVSSLLPPWDLELKLDLLSAWFYSPSPPTSSVPMSSRRKPKLRLMLTEPTVKVNTYQVTQVGLGLSLKCPPPRGPCSDASSSADTTVLSWGALWNL